MIEQAKTRLAEVTAGFSGAQQVMMGVVFFAVVGGLWIFSSWSSTTDMAPLYADLETSDAAAIVDELSAMGIDYELADRGRTVLVPRDQVYDIRLDMSTAGLPNGGSPGYSLLDNQGITSTQFQQRIAYQRALEGELSTTIRHIESIAAASVHLVMPEDDLFTADDIKATASVLVETTSTLRAQQVEAIVNLVSGSVEGLRAEDVTVADQTGLVLAAPGQTPFERAGTGGATGQTQQFESQLAAELATMLTAVVGPGNVEVTVSADMNWDASSSVSETHVPSGVAEGEDPLVLVESSGTENYSTNSTDGNGGILGGDDEATPASAESTYSADNASREYVFDTTVLTVESRGGVLERLGIAVLLDEASSTDAQLAEIETLVSSAAGIDTARGDTLAVSRLSFDTSVEEALAASGELEPSAAAAAVAGGGIIGTAILGAVALLIVVLAAVQFWRGRSRDPEVQELDLVSLTNSLSAGSARPIPAASVPTVDRVTSRSGESDDAAEPSSPQDELADLVDSQPDEVARLLRTWLADRRAVTR